MRYMPASFAESVGERTDRDIRIHPYKFPDNAGFSMLTGTTPSGEPIPAMTPESREVFNRYARIVGDPLPTRTRPKKGRIRTR